MLTVLGGLAEFERDLIRARTGEGRARAKARGVKMGRKPKLTAHQQREAIRRRDDGEADARDRQALQRASQHDFEVIFMSVTMDEKPFAFVLMPFDSEFADVYSLGIKETVEQAGMFAERVDEQVFHKEGDP